MHTRIAARTGADRKGDQAAVPTLPSKIQEAHASVLPSHVRESNLVMAHRRMCDRVECRRYLRTSMLMLRDSPVRGLLPPKGRKCPRRSKSPIFPITLYGFWPKMVAPPRDLKRRLRGPFELGLLDDFLFPVLPLLLVLCSSVLLGLPSPLPSPETLLQQKPWPYQPLKTGLRACQLHCHTCRQT